MSATDFPAEASYFAKPLPHARPFAFLLGAADSATVGLDLNGGQRSTEGGHDHGTPGGLTTASFVDLDLDLNCPTTTPTDTNTPAPSPSSLFCSPASLASPSTPLSSPFSAPGYYTPLSSPYQSPYAPSAAPAAAPAAAPMTAEAETMMAALNALRLELERERARMEAERRELQQARETVRQGEAALAADRARLGEQQQHLGAELERLAEKRVQLRAEKRAFRFMQREWERQVDARSLQAQGHTSDQPIVLADDDDDNDVDKVDDKAGDKVDKAPQAAVETKHRQVEVVVVDDDEPEAVAPAAVEPPKPRRIAKRKNKPQPSVISEEQTPAAAKKAKRSDSSGGGGDDGGGGGDGAKATLQGLDVEAGSHKLMEKVVAVVDERELFTIVSDDDDEDDDNEEDDKDDDDADESEGVTATQDSPWSSPPAPVPPVVEAEEKAGEALRSEPAETKPGNEAVVVAPPQNEAEAEAEAEDSRIGRGPSDEATGAAESAVARVEEETVRDVTAALPAERVSDARPDQMARAPPKEEAGGADMASEKPGHDEEHEEEEEEEEEEPAQLPKCRECCTTETTTWMRGPAGPCTLCDSCGHRFKKEEDARERARIERRQALAARKKKRKTLLDKQSPAGTQKKRLSPKATTSANDQEVIGKYATGVRNEAAASRVRRTNERLGASIPSYPHPASFGPIDGVDIGDWFPNRIITSKSGVHRPWVSGIHGTAKTGCYSIVLNGGYEDDVDHGTTFLYTGSGGRDLSGNKRTAPQTSDQPLNNNNASLVKSCDDHTPVRVVRGKRSGAYAPTEGYRYDGLYYVTRYWQEPGQSGFKLWRFKFKYGEDQTPPWEMEGYSEHRERWDTKHGLTQLSDDEGEGKDDDSDDDEEENEEEAPDDGHRGGKRRVKLEEEEEERDDGGHGHKKEERAGHRAKRAKVKAETSAKTTKPAMKKKKWEERQSNEPANIKKRKVMEAHSAADKENAKNGSPERVA